MIRHSPLGLAELHSHLYGTIRSADYLDYLRDREVDWTSFEIAYERAYGSVPPVRQIIEGHVRGEAGAAGDFHRLFVFAEQDAGSFERFQAKRNLTRNGSEQFNYLNHGYGLPRFLEEVHHFAHKVIDSQRREGIGYAEQRLGLDRDLPPGDARQVFETILNAYADYDGSDFAPRLAVSLPREDPWPLWEAVKDLALGPHGRLLTAIDFCNYEEGHPPKEKKAFFSEVLDFNRRNPERALAILYHVGESYLDKSLESAVRWVHEAAQLGAHRLGHADRTGSRSRPVWTAHKN